MKTKVFVSSNLIEWIDAEEGRITIYLKDFMMVANMIRPYFNGTEYPGALNLEWSVDDED